MSATNVDQETFLEHLDSSGHTYFDSSLRQTMHSANMIICLSVSCFIGDRIWYKLTSAAGYGLSAPTTPLSQKRRQVSFWEYKIFPLQNYLLYKYLPNEFKLWFINERTLSICKVLVSLCVIIKQCDIYCFTRFCRIIKACFSCNLRDSMKYDLK